MSNNPIPSDTTSLMVPIHLEAWVLDKSNQEATAWYTADYTQLKDLQSPLPIPFEPSGGKPEIGIHLHWALPDALTHGIAVRKGGAVTFPQVPNRWLIIRLDKTQPGLSDCKLWVVQSDYLGPNGTSAFLDPFHTSSMQVSSEKTHFALHTTNIGKNYTIDEWEASSDNAGKTFLRAAGPANVSFAAYVPFIKDVFSFTDTTVTPNTISVYSYMVAGWYSNPVEDDPLRGVNTYIQGIWKTNQEWTEQTPAARLSTLLAKLNWSIHLHGDPGTNVPATSLYHGAVIDVQWPFSTMGNAGIEPNQLSVAVAHTSTDALAALIQAEADKQSKNDQPNSDAWITAGYTLASLVEALMCDYLNDYGKPGANQLIGQKQQQTWYGSDPGGTIWEVVSTVPTVSGKSPKTRIPDNVQQQALNLQLAQLNQLQSNFDTQRQKLISLQEDLYRMWLKIGIGNTYDQLSEPMTDWSKRFPFIRDQMFPSLFNEVWDQYCLVQTARSALPQATDQKTVKDWVEKNWNFPDANGDLRTLTDLGLTLKAIPAQRFWHPNDPVVMISGIHRSKKFGEDGRYNEDGTLTCRLPGQTISGLQLAGLNITAQALMAAGVNLSPIGTHSTVPSIPSLLQELFFVDPKNASTIAGAIKGDPDTIQKAIETLLANDNEGNDPPQWIGIPPTPFSLAAWEQGWAPLFLEWELHYFPTGKGKNADHHFVQQDWNFNGEKYSWKGTGFESDYFIRYLGRTIITPQSVQLFKAKLVPFLKNNPDVDSKQLDTLITTIADWDIVSQSVSGLLDQLITQLSQEVFPPPPEKDMSVPCPRTGAKPPSVTALIGDQYHHMPVLEGTGLNVNYFRPVAGGFIQFEQLQIVDGFGQVYSLPGHANTGRGFVPIIGQDLIPDKSAKGLSDAAIQLTPRIIQPARLTMDFLSNDDKGKTILVSGNPNPVCGWLLPNHLENGVSVYDGDGTLLGELIALPDSVTWRPRPGPAGNVPPPKLPENIANNVLQSVVGSIAAQKPAVFNDWLSAIDETLWTIDPQGDRKDVFLSVLLGRPLAVVQLSLQLDLLGDPAYNQLWEKIAVKDASQPSGYRPNEDTGGIGNLPFPIRLGDPDLRTDGLIGYFLTTTQNKYDTFYLVHPSPPVSAGNNYLKPILSGDQYQGDITLNFQGSNQIVTLLMDPRGSVHAYTGILPVTTAALPGHLIDDFMRQMNVTFQTGPIIADPGTLRLPKPAEQHGSWKWIQASAPGKWEQDTIVPADDKARMPDDQLQLRDGWLQFNYYKPDKQ